MTSEHPEPDGTFQVPLPVREPTSADAGAARRTAATGLRVTETVFSGLIIECKLAA